MIKTEQNLSRTDFCGTPCRSADQELNNLLIWFLVQHSNIQLKINVKSSFENLQEYN